MAQQRFFGCCLCLATLLGAGGTWAGPPRDMVRNDWYLRESLEAIRDWEVLMKRVYPRKEKTPQPVFPVPVDDKPAAWPNPVFSDTADPDYKKMLAALAGAWEELSKRPRADLLSIRGTK